MYVIAGIEAPTKKDETMIVTTADSSVANKAPGKKGDHQGDYGHACYSTAWP